MTRNREVRLMNPNHGIEEAAQFLQLASGVTFQDTFSPLFDDEEGCLDHIKRIMPCFGQSRLVRKVDGSWNSGREVRNSVATWNFVRKFAP